MISKRLKSLREDSDMSQKDLAGAIGVSPSTIGMYESNKRTPDSEMLNRIADFFQVSVDYLLGRTNEKTPPINQFKPSLTGKDKINIEKEAQQMIDNLENADVVEFCGTPADDEDKEFLRMAYEKFLSDVRVYNKMKYTPKKYKK